MGVAATAPLAGANIASDQPPRRVEGKVALVTGSSGGLGRPTVLELARRGADVIVNGRSNREAAEETAAEARALGVRAIVQMADVGVEEQVESMVRGALAEFGRIDILINNAALYGDIKGGRFDKIAAELWDNVMNVNIKGIWNCCKACVPAIRPGQRRLYRQHLVPGRDLRHALRA